MLVCRLTKQLTQGRNPFIIPCFLYGRGSGKYSFPILGRNPFFSTKLGNAIFFPPVQVPNAKSLLTSYWKRCYSATSITPLQDGLKISRLSKQEAQNALFDYLHRTRGISFTDAEHMSKNSPIFLNNVLSKFEYEEDVGQSLTRFLRYHPINEFEPLFESLGVKPSELKSLLPQNLIFLNDDETLLENYHVLCNYGVPRGKIGKMYKEGMEMFRYEHGVLSLKLQSYEKLGLGKQTIIKLVTCCPVLLIGDINVNFLKVLEILKTFGVELDSIAGSLSVKSKYDWYRILEVLQFLDGIGCNKNGLSLFIKGQPRFVFDDSGKNIHILVVVLLKLGLKRSELLQFFENYIRYVTKKFTQYLWRSVRFLSMIGMENERIHSIVSKHALKLGSSYCIQSKKALRKSNLSAEELCNIIEQDPCQFSALTSRKKKKVRLPKVEETFIKEKTDFLLRIGFVENSDEMTEALSRFRGRGDELQKRFNVLVNSGLDCHTASAMIKLVPYILNQTSDVIKLKIDYLLNHLGYPLEALVSSPTYLCYSLEKIKLRFSMYNWVRKNNSTTMGAKNRKMVSSAIALTTILACSEARFVKYVVSLHPEGAEVWENLKNSLSLT